MKRKPLRETITENANALKAYEKMFNRETPYVALTMHESLKPKREKKQSLYADIKPTVPLEHEEQKNFVRWFRSQYPKVKIFAVPNAAARDHNAASYMKAEGLSAGCPDLWIPEFKTCIEMKRLKGSTTSPEQIEWRDYMLSIGWNAHICNGFEAAKNVILVLNK